VASLNLLQSGIGAFIGFLLGQAVNLVRFAWDRYKRPRLVIEELDGGSRILSHSTPIGDSHELVEERMYGFLVRNAGRSMAAGVRFQLLKIEYRERDGEFITVADHAFTLSVYAGADGSDGGTETSLVPNAAALVHLGIWRQDIDALVPAVTGLPDYYVETCAAGVEYRFGVVAFDPQGRYAEKTLTIDV
jgi:hypothetical protein